MGHLCYDELHEEINMCHHTHISNAAANGGYNCTCFHGYHLCADTFTCVSDDDFNEYTDDSRYNIEYDSSCGSGQFGFDNKCFSAHDQADYAAAHNHCSELGGRIA